ncbi:unnamed protein product [Prorocentrum cordatum]|uniref:Dienelactone hydrolase domain-containing protein n=1 Tax=Prorocentrum cordatum TaxID=2364126 RepID=A0ABN9PW61_9DINO|nr:unnamed protein product [Polarella glacialis]
MATKRAKATGCNFGKPYCDYSAHERVSLEFQGHQLYGYVFRPSGDAAASGDRSGSLPCMMIWPQYCGMMEYHISEATIAVADIALVCDYYSDAQVPHQIRNVSQYGLDSPERAMHRKIALEAMNTQLQRPQTVFRALVRAFFETAQALTGVNPEEIAAMGFCYGGIAVLEMWRQGLDVKGIVSLHGVFETKPIALGPGHAPPPVLDTTVDPAVYAKNCKVLIEHGEKDHVAPPDMVERFRWEMSDPGLDIQFVIHYGVGHGFALAPGLDGHHPAADARSYRHIIDFMRELFPRVVQNNLPQKTPSGFPLYPAPVSSSPHHTQGDVSTHEGI